MANTKVPRCTMLASSSGNPEARMRVNTLPYGSDSRAPESFTYSARHPFQMRSRVTRATISPRPGGSLDDHYYRSPAATPAAQASRRSTAASGTVSGCSSYSASSINNLRAGLGLAPLGTMSNANACAGEARRGRARSATAWPTAAGKWSAITGVRPRRRRHRPVTHHQRLVQLRTALRHPHQRRTWAASAWRSSPSPNPTGRGGSTASATCADPLLSSSSRAADAQHVALNDGDAVRRSLIV